MNYGEAIKYLKNLTKFGINLGLDRITELLRRVGNPHLKLKVIHIGGTNGKGSVANMVASVLQAAGYKTGIFTSPHLHKYTERYRINGEQISEARVAEILTMLKPHLDNMVFEGFECPTEFEVSTAMAFCYFYEEDVDLVVLEVGMGGAIDSTNVVHPLVSVITNVDMDHVEYLGNTICEIARTKAGIIKRGVPVVTAENKPKALGVIKDACLNNNAKLTIVGKDVVWYESNSSDISDNDESFMFLGQKFNVKTLKNEYLDLHLPLLGEHQKTNAATAIAVLEELQEYGIFISADEIRRGLSSVRWPGRFEIVNRNPVIVLDGAHNVSGVESLCSTLNKYFSKRNIVLVLGMLADKERKKIVEKLVPISKKVVVTKPNSPRAQSWQQIAHWAREFLSEVYLIERIPEAVDKAIEIADLEDVICITGSLYMLADARKHILSLKHK